MNGYWSVIITEIRDRRENSDKVMALCSIFSINDIRQRLKGERYSRNQEHGVIWESRDWGFMGGNSLLRQSRPQHLKSSNACMQEGHRIEDLI